MTSPIQNNSSMNVSQGVAPILDAAGEPIESVDLSLDGDILDALDTFEEAPACDWASGSSDAPMNAPRTPLSRLAQSAAETELVDELRALASDPGAPGTAARTALVESMSREQLQVFLQRVSLNHAAREELMQLLGDSGAIQHVPGRRSETDGSMRPPRTNGVANPMPWTPDGLRDFMHGYNLAEANRFASAYSAYRSDYKDAVEAADNPLELRALGAPVDSHENHASTQWPAEQRREIDRSLNHAGNSFALHTEVTNKLHALAGNARPFEFAMSVDAAVSVAGIEVAGIEQGTGNLDHFRTARDIGNGTQWDTILDPNETVEISIPAGDDVTVTGGANLEAREVYYRAAVEKEYGIVSAEVGVSVHLKIGPEFRDLDAPSFWRMSEEQLIEKYMEIDDQAH